MVDYFFFYVVDVWAFDNRRGTSLSGYDGFGFWPKFLFLSRLNVASKMSLNYHFGQDIARMLSTLAGK